MRRAPPFLRGAHDFTWAHTLHATLYALQPSPPNTNETTYKHNGFTRSAIAPLTPSPVPTPAHSRVCLPVGHAVHRRRARDGPHATRGTRRAACARARAHHPLRGAQTNSTCSRTSPPPSRTCPGDPGPEPDCPPLSRADGPRAATDGPAPPPAAPPIDGGGIPGRHCWSPMTIRSTLAWPGTRYTRLQAGCMRLQA